MKNLIHSCSLFLALFFASCDKGYQVRFSNLYIEPMDTVVINNGKIVFTDIGLQSTTEYKKISKGKFDVVMVSKSKKRIHSTIDVPSHGSGKLTIQIDGISQVAVLEE